MTGATERGGVGKLRGEVRVSGGGDARDGGCDVRVGERGPERGTVGRSFRLGAARARPDAAPAVASATCMRRCAR